MNDSPYEQKILYVRQVQSFYFSYCDAINYKNESWTLPCIGNLYIACSLISWYSFSVKLMNWNDADINTFKDTTTHNTKYM